MTTRLRADARRNHDLLVASAREVFLDQGPNAPLDEIARRAGVGIATLYRHFDDRSTLIRAVALDIWQQVVHEAESALAEEPDAFQALARYLHRAIDLRVGAIIPVLTPDLLMDDALRSANDRIAEIIETLMATAQAEGTLRPDVVFGDTGLVLIRLSRPLPGPFPADLDHALAHRHLDLIIDGLRASTDRPAGSLTGPAITLETLKHHFLAPTP